MCFQRTNEKELWVMCLKQVQIQARHILNHQNTLFRLNALPSNSTVVALCGRPVPEKKGRVAWPAETEEGPLSSTIEEKELCPLGLW